MLAFIKRRWILLLCVVVLLACTVVDVWIVGGSLSYCSVYQGNVVLRDEPTTLAQYYERVWNRPAPDVVFPDMIHPPSLGTRPLFHLSKGPFINIPIWLLLAAILGWLVFRELRWRQKRAK